MSSASGALKCYVGGSVDLDIIAQAQAKFSKAECHPRVRAAQDGTHLFEPLEDEENACKIVVDAWFRVEKISLASAQADGCIAKRMRLCASIPFRTIFV
ncbi:hypothetical protein CERZMDRAFT_103124 [Cercospora zeae-maydis SCOH1-5]|uniref:Uncharacterized protein n=1 Tax=Cercospora zeae-maydis SCOH1-5 TaxID=717836 RepID=A0A6A6F0H9_9PEZI|nr:hypothetical protein CERZMDRAFT_103124 [Cercospora zeae-maydis SCOH1-5]